MNNPESQMTACEKQKKKRAKGDARLVTGRREPVGSLINHYMAHAISDEPTDLGMCKRYIFFVAPKPLMCQGKGRVTYIIHGHECRREKVSG